MNSLPGCGTGADRSTAARIFYGRTGYRSCDDRSTAEWFDARGTNNGDRIEGNDFIAATVPRPSGGWLAIIGMSVATYACVSRGNGLPVAR